MTATFLEQAEKLKGGSAWQTKAWERLQQVGLPDRKEERFRYVRLRSYYEQQIELGELKKPDVPQGVIALPLSQAWQTYSAFLEKRYTAFLQDEKDPFVLLNAALDHEGLFLYVPPNAQIEEPLKLKAPSIIAYIAKGAEVTIDGDVTHIDLAIEEGAHVRLQREIDHFQSLRATVKRDATLKSVAFSSHASLARDDYHVQLLGEQADASLFGLNRLDGKQEGHTHVLMEHVAPHTTSTQKFKGVIADFARSTFEGKIYVHPEAQKTQAYQLSSSLILSPRAETKCKPNLEIFADDVKASHGATIGQLDQDALFYLQARGVPLDEAKNHLIEAFCREIFYERYTR